MIKYTGQVRFRVDVRLQEIRKVVEVLDSYKNTQIEEEGIVVDGLIPFTLFANSGWVMRSMIEGIDREFKDYSDAIMFSPDTGELWLVKGPTHQVKLDILTGDYPNPEQDGEVIL